MRVVEATRLRRGLAQFFGGGRSKAGEEVDAENLCLTPSNCERPSNSARIVSARQTP